VTLRLLALVALPLAAQVSVRYSPEPMAVPAAVLGNARDMGRWAVEMCSDSPGVVTLPRERVSMAAGSISFIDQDDALLVLQGHVRRSPASKAMVVLSWAGRGAAIALALASRANGSWAAGIGIGAGLAPDILTIIQSGITPPSAVPLVSTVRWPVVLSPGQCATDHFWAGKMKSPRPFATVIR
jgi:hypothetical protein